MSGGGFGEEDNTYYLHEVDLDEDDDNIEYDEVPEDFDEDAEELVDDFGAVIKNLKEGGDALAKPKLSARPTKNLGSKPTVVDDFIRNFLIKLGMSQTLDTFNTEWYKMSEMGQLNVEDIGSVADVYERNEDLDEQVKLLRGEVNKSKSIADKARGTWDKFRKERDFHRMHHRRVVQEKNMLIRDMKRLKKHYSSFEPALKAMRVKYETAMKDKMLMRLEKDRLQTKIEGLEETLRSFESIKADENSTAPPSANATKRTKSASKKPVNARNKDSFARRTKADSILPPDDRINPHLNRDYEPAAVQDFTLRKTYRGHQMAISGLALHPTKQIVATVSDDRTWKMWSIQRGELIMSGDGHKDWIAACDFHPAGNLLATASGDGTVKLWDFVKAACTSTFSDHTQAVWDVAMHDSGDFLASASMDHNTRLFDIASERCRQTFRGHVDSVNAVNFQPYSNNLVTASGDKTVSLWDVRSGLCIQTFCGHENAVLSASFNYQGDSIASSDSDGIIKLWDVRMVGELMEIVTADTGKLGQPINDVKFDLSGSILVAGSDAGVVKMYNVADTVTHLGDLSGPEGAVQSVVIDPNFQGGMHGGFIMAGCSDQTFRLFS